MRTEVAPDFWTGDRVRHADGLALEIAGDLDAQLLLTGGLLRAPSRRVGITGSGFEVITSG